MSTAISSRTPELIAAEINSIKNQTRNMVLYNSIEIGRRLVEAKELVPHGQWSEWLEKSIDYSQRTADNLIKIFNEYGSKQLTFFGNNANSQTFANLSYSQAVTLLGLPAEERKQFAEEHDLDNMSIRELQQAIKERDEALKKVDGLKKLATEKSEEAQKFQSVIQKVESDNRIANQVLKKTQADIKMLQDDLEKKRNEMKEQTSEYEAQLYELKEKLKAAQESGDPDAVAKLKQEKENLEQQLKAKPIETTVTTIEKVPEEVEQELNELRGKAQSSETTAKFKVQFDMLVKNFSALLGALDDIKPYNTEIYGKYKNAVSNLINKMAERL